MDGKGGKNIVVKITEMKLVRGLLKGTFLYYNLFCFSFVITLVGYEVKLD